MRHEILPLHKVWSSMETEHDNSLSLSAYDQVRDIFGEIGVKDFMFSKSSASLFANRIAEDQKDKFGVKISDVCAEIVIADLRLVIAEDIRNNPELQARGLTQQQIVNGEKPKPCYYALSMDGGAGTAARGFNACVLKKQDFASRKACCRELFEEEAKKLGLSLDDNALESIGFQSTKNCLLIGYAQLPDKLMKRVF